MAKKAVEIFFNAGRRDKKKVISTLRILMLIQDILDIHVFFYFYILCIYAYQIQIGIFFFFQYRNFRKTCMYRKHEQAFYPESYSKRSSGSFLSTHT